MLHTMLLHTAAIVLYQIVDRLHPVFLGLGRIDCAGGDMFLLWLLLQFCLEARQYYQVLIVLFVVLAIILFILSTGAF